MKNPTNRPQRNFVVEYKSNRRQPRETAKSIWGNTDLRALSEAVADDMPATIAARQPSETPLAMESAITPQPEPVLTELPPVAALREACPVVEPIAPVIEAAESVPASKKPEKVRKQRLARTAKKRAQRAPRASAAMRAAAISFDERDVLSALELENRRLKGLLVDKLRRENDELIAMLRRFED